MSHRNARLTPHGRLLLCERVEVQGWKLCEAAASAVVVAVQPVDEALRPAEQLALAERSQCQYPHAPDQLVGLMNG